MKTADETQVIDVPSMVQRKIDELQQLIDRSQTEIDELKVVQSMMKKHQKARQN